MFVLSAISQYVGASIAVTIFDEVSPRTVAWLRVIGAAVALLAVSRRHWRGWTRRELAAAAVFGIATALMNLFFYLAIDRIDLGKSVAIEFIGPIAVAAAQTRTGRNALALTAAAAGVAILGGVELADNAVGLAFLLVASALWAAYIVIGAHVARLNRGLGGLGIGLAIGAVAITPIGAPGSGAVWGSARLLLLALLVGVFSNAISYGIDQYVLRRIPVRRFSLLLALLPVTATFVGWIGLHQSPSVLEWAGIGLVLLGVAMQERDDLDRDPVAFADPA
ncbi:MAG: EamA family transporter [Actinomycetota bacterium]|nr:EamA family transporter [Actinomycetota bacterium]